MIKYYIFLIIFLFINQSISIEIIPIQQEYNINNRYIVENKLPFAEQTHEIIKIPNTNIILISQMSNSVLLKAEINKDGIIENLKSFQIGKNNSGLHGLALSEYYYGNVWITLENENKLVLIDPKSDSLNDLPEILKIISVPNNGFGPHYISEYGDELWVSLKESYDVLRINHIDISDYNIYNGLPHPIFVARHPITNMFYASQDDSSYIMRINPQNNEIKQIKIPQNIGETPVGLISGPNGIWFTLLGNNTNGTGTIGHINANDNISWFKLNSPLGSNASLLHLAFDIDCTNNYNIWLLSSSIINDNALDMVIKVSFDPQWKNINNEEVIVIPTQNCKAHRILQTKYNVFATELSTSKLFSLF